MISEQWLVNSLGTAYSLFTVHSRPGIQLRDSAVLLPASLLAPALATATGPPPEGRGAPASSLFDFRPQYISSPSGRQRQRTRPLLASSSRLLHDTAMDTGLFETLDENYWQHAINQNLLSAVRTTREALPHLRRSGSGRVINVTSVAVKQPIDGLMLSNATRLAVVGWAKTLSRELAPHGITVNNICPGNIATERLISLIEDRARRQKQSLEEAVALEEGRVPIGFLGEPDDVANLAVFLASDKARYITGATIQVDGGSTTAIM